MRILLSPKHSRMNTQLIMRLIYVILSLCVICSLGIASAKREHALQYFEPAKIADPVVFSDLICTPVDVSRTYLRSCRPKNVVCNVGDTTYCFREAPSDPLACIFLPAKISTVIEGGHYVTYSSFADGPVSVIPEYCELHENSGQRKTCVTPDFGPPFGQFFGRATSDNGATDKVQMIEYKDGRGNTRGIQTLNIAPDENSEYLNLALRFPTGETAFFISYNLPNVPLSECASLYPPCTDNEKCYVNHTRGVFDIAGIAKRLHLI